MKPLIAIALLGLFSAGAQAGVLYDITGSVSNPFGTTAVTGHLEFSGDLSTDGIHTYDADDIEAFSVTFDACAGPCAGHVEATYDLADLAFGSSRPYNVVAGELAQIRLISSSFNFGNINPSPDSSLLYNPFNGPSLPCSNVSCSGSYTLTRATPVPTPAPFALMAVAAFGLLARRKAR